MRKIKDFLAENWGWSIPIIFVTLVLYTIYNNNKVNSIKRLEEENTERIKRAEIVADSIYQLEQDSKAKTLLGEIIENEKPFYRENWLEYTSTLSMLIQDTLSLFNNKVLISQHSLASRE
jgi:hypothetical protein